MSASYYSHNSSRPDSDLKVDVNADLHNRPSVSHGSSGDDEYNKINTSKRARSDASINSTEPPTKAFKKGRVGSISRDKTRVLCPFYKKDPVKHAQTVSCYNTGFEEMSRLKQHLIHVHGVKKESLNLKNHRFLSLGTVEEKWTRVFRDLFPGDDIPSPYKNEAVIRGSAATTDMDSALLHVKLESIIAQHGVDSELAARISTAFQGALGDNKCVNDVPGDNYGLLTPPSSTKSSPAMSQMDIFTTPSFDSFPELPSTPGVLQHDFVDPLLYPTSNVESMPLFDSDMSMESAWSSHDPTPLIANPINTWDKASTHTDTILPPIDVCFNCLSTNIIYGFPSTCIDEPQPSSGNFVNKDSQTVQTHTGESLLADPFMGADAVVEEAESTPHAEVDWEGWTPNDDYCDKIWIESDELAIYSEVDKLFEI